MSSQALLLYTHIANTTRQMKRERAVSVDIAKSTPNPTTSESSAHVYAYDKQFIRIRFSMC